MDKQDGQNRRGERAEREEETERTSRQERMEQEERTGRRERMEQEERTGRRERMEREEHAVYGERTEQEERTSREEQRQREARRREREAERKKSVKLEYTIVALVIAILFVLALLKVGLSIWNRVREAAIQQGEIEMSEGDSWSGDAQTEGEPRPGEKAAGDMRIPDPGIDVQLITVNEWSRPGTPTDPIEGVVVHYIGNPGTTAQENHDYFENLKDYQDTYMSSNFLVGLEGEIIQNVPTSEVAYASNGANHNTVSIECCHPDETGKFNDATYESAVHLVAYLCEKFGLERKDIIRHYDVTGKECPKYFVDHPDAWEKFKEDVVAYMNACGVDMK